MHEGQVVLLNYLSYLPSSLLGFSPVLFDSVPSENKRTFILQPLSILL
jgi:hypothetical protein